MWFGVITLFPEMFSSLNVGVIGRAQTEQKFKMEFWNPRDYVHDHYQSVDDKPYGGGPGLIMQAEPLKIAMKRAKQAAPSLPYCIYLTPQGKVFNHIAARQLSKKKSIILLAGRYEGIDERIIEQEIDEEWSLGDFILTGGELAAMAMMDSIVRLLPGVIGNEDSIAQDSFSLGLLKYPQYTRPEKFAGQGVPEVLLSGHHEQIRKWRSKQMLGKTWLKRPDLLEKQQLNEEEQCLLNEFIAEYKQKLK